MFGVLIGAAALSAMEPDPASLAVLGVTDIEELNLESLLGTVSAASRVEESRLLSPASVSVLTREDIQASGALTVPDVLRSVPGTQVERTAPGSYRVSLRGMGGAFDNHLVVLLDGVPIHSRMDGSPRWAGLPVDLYNLERIEIVRGPVSTIYGANAMTGVIDLITAPVPGGPIRGAVRAGLGIDESGFPLFTVSGRTGGQIGRFSYRTSGYMVFDMSFRKGVAYEEEAAHGDHTAQEGELHAHQSPQLSAGHQARLSYRLLPRTHLIYDLANSYGRGSDADMIIPTAAPLRAGRHFGVLRLVSRDLPAPIEELGAFARLRWFWSGEDEVSTRQSYREVRSLDLLVGFDLRLRFWSWLSASVGASGGMLRVDAPFLDPMETGAMRNEYGAYAQVVGDVSRHFRLALSGRLDAGARLPGLRYSMRISAIYHQDTFSVRLTGANAFREPTYLESSGRFVDPADGHVLLSGDPLINTPNHQSVEAGLLISPNRSLFLSGSIFFQNFSNLANVSEPEYRTRFFFSDADPIRLLGAEVEARWRVNQHLSLLLNLTGLYWLQADEDHDGYTGDPQQNSPVLGWLGARTTWFDGQLHASLGIGYAAPRSFHGLVGSPPLEVDFHLTHQVRLDFAADYRPSVRLPFRWLLKLQSYLPHGVPESPVPGAGQLGTLVFVGCSYEAD